MSSEAQKRKIVLALEDGTVFHGSSFGAEGTAFGEAVFFTGVVGYQEVLTDPSFKGKLVVMSYPLIGNYGVNDRDSESDSCHGKALIVKEISSIHSNWLAKGSLPDFMREKGVIGIEGVDTRALTVHIRDKGEMWGAVSTEDLDGVSLVKKIAAAREARKAEAVSVKKPSVLKPKKKDAQRVILIDLGATASLLAALVSMGFEVIRMPHDSKASEILEKDPKVVVLSTGPEETIELPGVVSEIKKLVGKKPLFGMGVGMLLLATALGCKVKKMKCGHHGLNQAVKELKTKRCDITSQSHSHTIDEASLPKGVDISHVNLNDRSVEGIKARKAKAGGILFMPNQLKSLEEMIKHA